MRAYRCTECAYEVDERWFDHTRYTYESGEVRVLVEPYCARADGPEQVDAAIARFHHIVPGYTLVERRSSERPAPDSLIVAHRLGGLLARFEIGVFWALGENMWVMRASAPFAEEERCREALQSFLDTYQPVEAL